MQQRRLRLGDIVDDYCPRERRITNHAVVAMIEDKVKQTRCTTCDAEHEYKQARIPAPRRRKDSSSAHPADAVAGAPRKRSAADPADSDAAVDSPSAMDSTVPFDAADTNDVPAPAEETVVPQIEAPDADAVPLQASDASANAVSETGAAAAESDASESAEPTPVEDEGPVHRRLIRATLPRPEGQAPERKLPEFTMHQRDINGNRPGRSHRRGPRPGQMRTQQGNGGQSSRFGGQRQGPRHGPGQGGQGGGQGQAGQPRRRKRRR